MADAKLSDPAIAYLPSGGIMGTDLLYLVRGDGASPEVFTSYKTTAIELMEDEAFRGALVKKSADQTAANYSGAGSVIAWNAEAYDHGGWHDTVTANSRLTVPAGVTKVRAWAHVRIANQTADTYTGLQILKNGVATYDGLGQVNTEAGLTSVDLQTQTAVIEVVPGDYFETLLFTESDTSIDIIANRSSFAIEAIE